MRYTRLTAVLGVLLALPSLAFDITSPSPWFDDTPVPEAGLSHDTAYDVTSNGVTKTQLQHLYRDDYIVTGVDLSDVSGGITNLTAGDNVVIEDVGSDGKVKRISAVGGLEQDGVNALIRLYDSTNLTLRIDAKADQSEVPTSVSQLSNDSGFVTASVTNGLASSDYVDAAVGDVRGTLEDKLDTSVFTEIVIPATNRIARLEYNWDGWFPTLIDYATNNYAAARLANHRARRLEAWQWDIASTRAVYEMGYDHWTWTKGADCPDDFIHAAHMYGAPKPVYVSTSGTGTTADVPPGPGP